MQAKIYDAQADWNAKEVEIMSELGIPTPDGQTLRYAEIQEIDNPDSGDFGKYPFPVLYHGTWKTNEYFDEGELVDWDPNWFLSSIIPPE